MAFGGTTPQKQARRREQTQVILDTMRTRRACRAYVSEPVDEGDLRHLLEAARWAPSAGNRRLHKFLVVRDRRNIELIRQVAPGMLGEPTALIVICTDLRRAEEAGVRLNLDLKNPAIDVGAAAQNMLLVAQALGLGACPLTSFSLAGARAVLELPEHLVPEYIVQLGHPDVRKQPPGIGGPRLPTLDELTYWDRVLEGEPS